jgi:integrase/recombinase XerC
LIVHTNEFEGDPSRRPLSRDELVAFFDFCDAQVAGRRALRRKGSLAALRDAALFKTIYAWGLRRQEAARLDVVDFARNPHKPDFGAFGSMSVRYGKAMAGGPPRRRNVLTVFDWAVEVIDQYVQEIRPLYGRDEHPALWLSERGARVSSPYISERFAHYRDQLGLPRELTPHGLRHSYVTHLIEDGFDPLFVQMQVGHRHASTTAIYTAVNGDFKQRALADALRAQLETAGA